MDKKLKQLLRKFYFQGADQNAISHLPATNESFEKALRDNKLQNKTLSNKCKSKNRAIEKAVLQNRKYKMAKVWSIKTQQTMDQEDRKVLSLYIEVEVKL